MPKTKAKQSPVGQSRRFVYVLVWAVGAAVMGWLTYALTPALSYLQDQSRWTFEQFSLVSLLVGTLLVWSIPVLATERLLKRSMRNWLVYTLLGTLTLMLWSDLFPWNSRLPLVTFLSSLAHLSVPVFQMAWLWRRVNKAWLWPVSHILMGQVMRLFPPFAGPLSSPLAIVAALPQMLVYASVMCYLWTQAKEPEKAKVNVASAKSTQSDESRIQRLQEADEHFPPWDYGEINALHNEA
jgi:hypothetical protein